MQRPNWTQPSYRKGPIDLSLNVHYDSKLNAEIRQYLGQLQSFHDYPDQYQLYDSVSSYYNVPIDQLAIGYGATEMLERIFKSLEFDNVYCVEPSFQMIEVYANIFKKNYISITIKQLYELNPLKESILVIANPNGNNGESHDIESVIDRFKYVISDEVYGDFYGNHSLLNKPYFNTIVVKSFSKSLGLAGFRCGFSVAPKFITEQLQSIRSNFVMCSFSSLIIPKVIHHTPEVVKRMNETKSFLEHTFKCKPSTGNYVLFEQSNRFTERFGAKYVEGYYRMALTDIEILVKNESH
jgi:histidinol-phosphate/aromatic aminotransferase/cobyric acid decarboxylase-like protein